MLTAYLGALGFGLVFVVASAFLGDHGAVDKDVSVDKDFEVDKDLSVDKDLDADHEVDHDADHVDSTVSGKDLAMAHGANMGDVASLLLPFLSLRFWTYAATAFGATGALLTLLGVPGFVHISAALIMGLTCGYAVAALIRALKDKTVATEADLRSARGVEAEVVLPVGPGKTGKVRLTMGGQRLELIATTREATRLERGQKVLVVSVEGGTADVSSMLPERKAERAAKPQDTSA